MLRTLCTGSATWPGFQPGSARRMQSSCVATSGLGSSPGGAMGVTTPLSEGRRSKARSRSMSCAVTACHDVGAAPEPGEGGCVGGGGRARAGAGPPCHDVGAAREPGEGGCVGGGAGAGADVGPAAGAEAAGCAAGCGAAGVGAAPAGAPVPFSPAPGAATAATLRCTVSAPG